MDTVADLRAFADRQLFEGGHAGALHGYAALVRIQAENLDARLRVADALLALGEVQRAAEVYTALARHASHAGYPLRGLVAMKILSALEPQLGALLSGVAELYAVDSDRITGLSTRLSPGDPKQGLPSGLAFDDPPPTEQLAEAATALATDYTAVAAYPEKLPPIPLFSELPADAFAAVLAAMKLVRTPPGQTLIQQGDPGQSFYVLTRGDVRITRQLEPGHNVTLAALGEGAIFGEMAIVSDLPRSATVTAVTDCDLLEFDRNALAAASKEIGTIARALDKFARERLLTNLLVTAPLFKPLERKQRLDLMRRFTAHDLPPNTSVITEGQPGQGLYVVLSGEVDVSKVDQDEKVLLATLRSGEVFGEISLLHDEPTSASVTTAGNATVLFLDRIYFQRLIEAVPAIREYIEGLGEERLMDTQILMSGEFDDEGPTQDDSFIRV